MKGNRTGIIDYGMGNLLSVFHAFESVGADIRICKSPRELKHVDRIVLPGVGAFGNCMRNLESTGFKDALNDAVLRKMKPALGICLGMQVMGRKSLEGGEHSGLGWIDADIVPLTPTDKRLRVPHVGWNEIRYRPESPLFSGLPEVPDCYFVHSFFMKCDNQENVDAVCDYAGIFTAAIRRDNIFATQFHPEKSQNFGLCILENFLNWKP